MKTNESEHFYSQTNSFLLMRCCCPPGRPGHAGVRSWSSDCPSAACRIVPQRDGQELDVSAAADKQHHAGGENFPSLSSYLSPSLSSSLSSTHFSPSPASHMLSLQVNYFNEVHAVWEPLIERVDSGKRRWNLELKVKLSNCCLCLCVCP